MKFKSNELMVIFGGSTTSSEVTPQAEIVATVSSPMMRLAAPYAAAPHLETGGTPCSVESWVPHWRSTDSLSLLGESGVLQVGVNDLGWVVYDWIPGP